MTEEVTSVGHEPPPPPLTPAQEFESVVRNVVGAVREDISRDVAAQLEPVARVEKAEARIERLERDVADLKAQAAE